MKSYKFYSLFFSAFIAVLFSSTTLLAQNYSQAGYSGEGCTIGSEFYPSPLRGEFENGIQVYSGGVKGRLYDSCGQDANLRYIKTGSVGAHGTCYVEFNRLLSDGSREYSRDKGSVVNFKTVQCPIDDYIPAVVMAIAGAGFFLIRRRDFAI